MPAIGYVTKSDNGSFKGQLRTLSIRADIDIVANANRSADTQPHYRVLSDGVEIGAGWNRRCGKLGPRLRVAQPGGTRVRPTPPLRQSRARRG